MIKAILDMDMDMEVMTKSYFLLLNKTLCNTCIFKQIDAYKFINIM